MKNISQIHLVFSFSLFLILISCTKTKIEERNIKEINSEVSARPNSACPSPGQNLAGPDKIICASLGSVQIGLPPTSGFSYNWTPTTGLSNPLISNPIASPSTTTNYTLTTTYNNTNHVLNGDFELGNSQFNSEYIYDCNSSTFLPNDFCITSNSQYLNSSNCYFNNHTSGGNNMMIVNGAEAFSISTGDYRKFWQQNVTGLSNNTIYYFSFWVYSANPMNTASPRIRVKVNGNIESTTNHYFTSCSAGWQFVQFSFGTGLNSNSNIELVVADDDIVNSIFAIDDISLTECSLSGQSNTDQVVVQVLNTCPTAQITTSSYFKFGGCMDGSTYPPEINPPNQPIIPNTYNTFCTFSDCGGLVHLFSNLPNNNQWYKNDIPIFGATGQELIDGSYSFSSFTKFQVKNTTFGNNQLSAPTYVRAYLNPSIGYIRQNTYIPNSTINSSVYAGVHANSYSPGTIFNWSVPGCTVTNLTPDGNQVSIFVPLNIGTTGFNGTITVSNSACQNGVIPIHFTYNGP
jgi:hypothetical protein